MAKMRSLITNLMDLAKLMLLFFMVVYNRLMEKTTVSQKS